jgi:cytochrome c556
MVGPAFEPHAQAFIASYGQLNAAEDVQGQIEAHNNLVKSCVACHMNFCQGPIPRIEKLYVQ